MKIKHKGKRLVRRAYGVVLALLCLCGCGEGKKVVEAPLPENPLPPQTTVERRANTLGFELLLSPAGDDDRIISPAGVYSAFNLLAEYAHGDTREVLMGILDWREGQNAFAWNPALEKDTELWYRLGIFADEQQRITQTFEEAVRDKYKGQMLQVEMHNPHDADYRLRDWLRGTSEQPVMLRELVSDMGPEDMGIVMAVQPAICWQVAFEVGEAEPFYYADNTMVALPRMSRAGMFYWAEDKDLQAVSVPMTHGLSCVFVQSVYPEEMGAPKMDNLQWEELLEKLEMKRLEVNLPVCGAGGEISVLEALGLTLGDQQMTIAEEMTTLRVMEQSQNVAFDERGLSADGLSMPPTPADYAEILEEVTFFSLDKPFFFGVVEEQTGLIWLMGTIEQPVRLPNS